MRNIILGILILQGVLVSLNRIRGHFILWIPSHWMIYYFCGWIRLFVSSTPDCYDVHERLQLLLYL
jgi:hypothetical protein